MSNPKRQRQRRLEREQRAIERRLAGAVAPNLAGPLLGRAPIRYEWAQRDRGVANGGIGMIARLVEAVGLASEIDASVDLLKVHRPYHRTPSASQRSNSVVSEKSVSPLSKTSLNPACRHSSIDRS